MRMETQRGIVETFLDDYEDIFPKLYPSVRCSHFSTSYFFISSIYLPHFMAQGTEEDGPWSEERLLLLLRPSEKELAMLRRPGQQTAGGSAVGKVRSCNGRAVLRVMPS